MPTPHLHNVACTVIELLVQQMKNSARHHWNRVLLIL